MTVVTSENAQHWDEVVRTKEADQFSWYQDDPRMSLRLIEHSPGSVIDVGAGTSSLVDHLLADGRADVTVLDVSEEALDLTRRRLGPAADEVSFEVADIVTWKPDRTYDVWHDRALFHFLTESSQRDHYVDLVSDAVATNGIVVLGTFAQDGPTHCSGLPTARYSPGDLAGVFSDHFGLEHHVREKHRTPVQVTQPFTWVVLRHD